MANFAYDCKRFTGRRDENGMVALEKCQGCFDTVKSKHVGGMYDSRPQCVRDSGARKVRIGV